MTARFDDLMMNYPLTLTHFFERSRRLFARKTIATRVPGRPMFRYTYADFAERPGTGFAVMADWGVAPEQAIRGLDGRFVRVRPHFPPMRLAGTARATAERLVGVMADRDPQLRTLIARRPNLAAELRHSFTMRAALPLAELDLLGPAIAAFDPGRVVVVGKAWGAAALVTLVTLRARRPKPAAEPIMLEIGA